MKEKFPLVNNLIFFLFSCVFPSMFFFKKWNVNIRILKILNVCIIIQPKGQYLHFKLNLLNKKNVYMNYSNILFMFSYRQNISVNFVMQELAFKTTVECLEFLEPFNLTFADNNRTSIDCKASMAALANI